MSQHRTCEYCGATLDPCESCDCEKEKAAVSAPTPTTATEDQPLYEYYNHSIAESNEKCKLTGEMIFAFVHLDIEQQREAIQYIKRISDSAI